MTMVEMAEKVVFEDPYTSTKFAKNLFYADKKDKTRMWFVCTATDTVIDLKALTKAFGCGSGNLRAASEDAMYNHLGAKKGGLNLFALINDTEKAVQIVVDKRLTEEFDFIGCHPMVNTATTAVSKEAFMKVIELSQHEPKIMDFTALAPAAPIGGGPAKPQKQKGKGAEEGKQQPKQKPQKAKRAKDVDQRGIEFTKEANFSLWYAQVITKAELIEYYDVSGCYILRPNSFYIWE